MSFLIFSLQGPEALQTYSASEPAKIDSPAEQETKDNSFVLALHSPIRSQDDKPAARCQLFRPSGANDDDAVDGYTFRMQDPNGGINYDDLLIVREAFSENDAFSMSDTSDVAVGDLDFDDVCLTRKLSFEEHGACASPPSECETPSILAMSDDMLDAYLQMEEEILEEEERMKESLGSPIERRRNGSGASSDLEFWSVSPRDDPMMSSLEFSQGELLAEELDQEPVILHAGEQGYQQLKRRESCGFCATLPPLSSSLLNDRERDIMSQTVSTSAPAVFEPWMAGKYTPGPIDFLSPSAAEDILYSMGSSDEEDQYGGDAEDNDIWDEPEQDATIMPDQDALPELFAFEDDDFKTPTKGGLYDDDADKQAVKKEITPPPMIPTSLDLKPKIYSYFPPVVTSTSAPLDWSNVPTPNYLSAPTIVRPSGTSRGFFPKLYDEDDFMAVQEALSDDAEKDGMEFNNSQEQESKSQLQELRKSLTSTLGSSITRKNLMPDLLMPSSKYQKDDLLEITDLSLSHMCESLDFMTELSHWIMPIYQDNDPPVKDTDEQPVKDTNKAPEKDNNKDANAPEQNLSQRLQDMQNQYSSLRRSSGTQSPSLSFEDLFDDLSESCKSGDVGEVAAEEENTWSETESFSLSLSSHESEKRPTRGSPASRRVRRDPIAEQGNRPESLSELNVQNTSIGSIDLPEFKSPETEALSQPESTTSSPADDDVFEASPCHSQVAVTTEPFTSDTDTAAQSNTEDGDHEDQIEEDHQAYFTYVSQLAEACSEGELTKYFGKYHQQKCHVWSLGLADTVGYPSSSQGDDEEEAEDIRVLEKEIADAELNQGCLDCELVLDDEEAVSQCSDSTDKLMEASDQLVKELQDRRRLQMDPLPESEIGSWRDVVVLWLRDNEESEKVGALVNEVSQTDDAATIKELTDDETTEASKPATQTQLSCEAPCADVTDSGVWTVSPSSSLVNVHAAAGQAEGSGITVDVDSGRFSEPSEVSNSASVL